MIKNMKILWALLWIGLISSFFFLTLQQWLICLILGHFLGGIGQPIAIHRYFTHRAFKTNKFWHYFLMYTSVICAEGSTIIFKAAHIKHHRYTDKEGDPHSPKYMGLWKVFWGFFYQNHDENKMNMIYVKDLIRDKEHRFIHNHYFKLHAVYFFTLLMISPILVYALYIFPAMYSIIGGGVVNTAGHYSEQNPGNLQNNLWVTLLFMDGDHIYHHENPADYRIPFPYWTNTFIKLIKTN
jgi:fatty-acid desaturase